MLFPPALSCLRKQQKPLLQWPLLTRERLAAFTRKLTDNSVNQKHPIKLSSKPSPKFSTIRSIDPKKASNSYSQNSVKNATTIWSVTCIHQGDSRIANYSEAPNVSSPANRASIRLSAIELKKHRKNKWRPEVEDCKPVEMVSTALHHKVIRNRDTKNQHAEGCDIN